MPAGSSLLAFSAILFATFTDQFVRKTTLGRNRCQESTGSIELLAKTRKPHHTVVVHGQYKLFARFQSEPLA